MQHLLLGMNVYINLDLGITTATLAGSPERLPGMRSDFDAVNDALASMVDLSQDALTAASPWFGLVDHLGGLYGRGADLLQPRRARDQAWALAQHLVTLPPAEWPAEYLPGWTGRWPASPGASCIPGFGLSVGLTVVRVREPWTAGHVLDAVEHTALATP